MMQDESWHRVRIAAADAGLADDKVERLRALHARMYDEAQTASECFALELEALAEVARQANMPKPLTVQDQLDALKLELAEFKAERT